MPYTELSRSTKKLFLFLSPQNKFWSLISPEEMTQEEVAELLDIAPTTLSHWKQSWNVGAVSVRRIYQSMEKLLSTGELTTNARGRNGTKRQYVIAGENLAKARDLFARFRKAHDDDSVDFYTTGKLMDMKVVDCQQLIDGLIYNQAPLFPGIYYDSERSATEYFERYAGIYLLWVRRRDAWLQCPVRVRYKLTINGLPTIRCKLNAPIRRPQGNERHWEYDGFLTGRDNRNYWIFEKRKKAERYDHFYFITGRGFDFRQSDTPSGEPMHLTMRGTYLTADQNLNQDIVSDKVFLQRQDNHTEEEQIRIMHSMARVLSTAESETVTKHFEDFNTYLDAD